MRKYIFHEATSDTEFIIEACNTAGALLRAESYIEDLNYRFEPINDYYIDSYTEITGED